MAAWEGKAALERRAYWTKVRPKNELANTAWTEWLMFLEATNS